MKLGQRATNETRVKMSNAQKGKIVSVSTREKLSVIFKKRYAGNNHPMYGIRRLPETIEKMRKSKLGTKQSIETRRKRSLSMIGKNTKNKDGVPITPKNEKIRKSMEYKLWREAVFKRDDYTCVVCKKRGIELNADHIKSFSLFPELRFAIDNGRTLCVDCHRKTDTYGGKKLASSNIIGNGDIANTLSRACATDKLFFASGVSNSQETRESEFKREADLLLQQDKNKHIVYFGSLSIFSTPLNAYSQHKKNMEELVKNNFQRYTIFRIGNISFGVNPNTLINHLVSMARSGEPLDIQDKIRYVIEEKEFLHWINWIPDWSCEMNVPGRMMTVQEVVDKYVAPHFTHA